jgi:hypothetical protein
VVAERGSVAVEGLGRDGGDKGKIRCLRGMAVLNQVVMTCERPAGERASEGGREGDGERREKQTERGWCGWEER